MTKLEARTSRMEASPKITAVDNECNYEITTTHLEIDENIKATANDPISDDESNLSDDCSVNRTKDTINRMHQVNDTETQLFEKNDLLLIISSSGNSKNIKEVVKYSKKKGVKVIGFSGFKGGYLKNHSDISVHIPADNYGISEDSHHILMHIIIQYLILKQKKEVI